MLLHFPEEAHRHGAVEIKAEIFVTLKKHPVRLKGHIVHPYCNLERESF